MDLCVDIFPFLNCVTIISAAMLMGTPMITPMVANCIKKRKKPKVKIILLDIDSESATQKQKRNGGNANSNKPSKQSTKEAKTRKQETIALQDNPNVGRIIYRLPEDQPRTAANRQIETIDCCNKTKNNERQEMGRQGSPDYDSPKGTRKMAIEEDPKRQPMKKKDKLSWKSPPRISPLTRPVDDRPFIKKRLVPMPTNVSTVQPQTGWADNTLEGIESINSNMIITPQI